VVITAEVGCVLTATERRLNESAVMRYRTPQGWISEFRRDHQRNPIVEVLELPRLSAQAVEEERAKRAALKTEAEISAHCLEETLTLRESACLCLIKCNAAVRQVATYVSRSMYGADTPTFGRTSSHPSFTQSANAIAAGLTEIAGGFFAHPLRSIPAGLLPDRPGLGSKVPSLSDLDASGSSEPARSGEKGVAKASPAAAKLPPSGEKKTWKRIKPRSVTAEAEVGEVDLATLCLYYGAVVKQFLLPVVEDKNGGINVLLLRALCNAGASDQFCDAFSTLFLVLRDELDRIPTDASSPELSVTGRCALYTLPIAISALNRLSSLEVLNKSIAGGNLSNLSSVSLSDESGPFHVHELLFQVFSSLRSCVTPLLEARVTKVFPSDLQRDWLAVVCELLQSMSAALPTPPVGRRSQAPPGSSPAPRLFSGLTPTRPVGGGAGSPTPAQPVQAPNPVLLNVLVDMGFDREQATSAMNALRSSNVDALVQYMIITPWSAPTAATAAPPTVDTSATGSEVNAPVSGAANEGTSGNATVVPEGANASTETLSSAEPSTQQDASQPEAVAAEQSSSAASAAAVALGEHGALPSLVMDLDEATGGGSPTAAPSGPSAVASEPSSAVQAEGSQQPSAHHGLTDGAANVMASLASLMRSGRTSDAQSRTPAPSRSTEGARNKPAADDASREVAESQGILTEWASEMGQQIVPNVLATCLNFDRVRRWEPRESHMLIPYLVDVLDKLKQGASPAKGISFSDLFDSVVELLFQEVEQKEARLYGLLYLVNQMILVPTVRKALTDADKLSRESCTKLVGLVRSSVEATASQKDPTWHNWMSPAMLLLYELLTLPGTGTPQSVEKVTGGVKGAQPAGTWDEKEETADLCESKTSTGDAPAKSPGASSSALLVDHTYLLSSPVREEIFSLLMSVLAACRTSKLDPESMQGVVIVLLTLLGNQSFANKFIAEDGLVTLLSLLNGEDALEHRVALFRIVTLIVRRCMETEVELEQAFSERIREIVKANQAEDKCMPFTAFLRAMKLELLRSPDDFWRACRNTIKIIRVSASSRKSDQSEAEGKAEIKVRLVEADPSRDLLSLRVNAGESDHRAYATLKALLRQAVELVSRRAGSPARTPEANASHMLTVSGILNAAADAILSLRRAPVLAAKLIRTETECLLLRQGENFVDFLISRFGAAEGEPETQQAGGVGGGTLTPDITASTRLLVALCAFKGPSRLIAVDSVLKNFRTYCVTPREGGKGVSPSPAAEAQRVKMVARFASLIGIVIRASKGSSRDDSYTKGQGVSVDTLHLLVEHGHILQLLTQALATIPVQMAEAAGAVAALMDLMELITRPKILAHLDKMCAHTDAKTKSSAKSDGTARLSSQASDGGDVDTVASHYAQSGGTEHTAEDMFLMGGEEDHRNASLRGASTVQGVQRGGQGPRFGQAAQQAHHLEQGDEEDSNSEDSDEDEDDEDEDEDDDDEDGVRSSYLTPVLGCAASRRCIPNLCLWLSLPRVTCKKNQIWPNCVNLMLLGFG
jgi:hypothetical protein